ncbi:MAG: hypothetical protein JO197_12960 [Acidobacteria bacterium]|nr:hypothetical protein [Acidobacteriota bacterium]MBV9478220.1 hypothetical protein [Acidobacteriota bacterium]
MLRFLRKHRIALIAIAAYNFVLFFPVLFMGRAISPNDVYGNFAPWAAVRGDLTHAQNSLLNDPPTAYFTLMSLVKNDWRAFHWNPYVASGIPGFGSSAAAMLSPFILLPVLLVPLTWVYTAIVFLKLNVSFLFAYLWLREERLGRRGAAIGALVVAGAGVYAVRWLWQITNATTLYPALLWLVSRARHGKRTSIALTAFVAFAFALAGFPAAIAYGAYVVVAYALRPMRVSLVARNLAAVVIALLLVLPSLVPFAQLLQRSGYLEARQSTSLAGVYPVSHWRGFVQPDRLGNPSYKNFTGDPQLGVMNNYVESTIYLGLLTLPLALLGLCNRRARTRWFWLAVAVLVLGCMFGAPGIAPFFARLPGFKYSALARVGLLLPLPAGYLAGAGAAWLRVRFRDVAAGALAIAIAADLALVAGRFHPYLTPEEAAIPQTPTLAFLQHDRPPFRIAPFFNYLWPNTSELVCLEDVRSHFGSEAAYRKLLLRIDPTSWGGSSTVITFNSLKFNLTDPLVRLLGIRWFIEHRDIDIVKWTIFQSTVPGVKETGTFALRPGAVLQRTIRVDAEPFWAIEVPMHLDAARGRVDVMLLKNDAVVWSRAFTQDDVNFLSKIYVPLRPYARLGESVVLRVRAHSARGWMLQGENANAAEAPLFYGRVTIPIVFDRAFIDGKLFRNLGELPRFRGVAHLRKLNDDEFLATKDVDFERESVIGDQRYQPPELADTPARVALASYAPNEQRIVTDASNAFFLASSEKLTPELRITIDGKAVRPVRCDLLFAGTIVPAGHHTVVYSRRIARGWWPLAIVGFVVWVFVAIAEGVRRPRRRTRRIAVTSAA